MAKRIVILSSDPSIVRGLAMTDPVEAVAQVRQPTEPPPQIPMDPVAPIAAVLLLLSLALGLGIVLLLRGAP